VEQVIERELPASDVQWVVETQSALAACLVRYFKMQIDNGWPEAAPSGDCYDEACNCAGV
jgi:hypothetical protein